MSEYIVLIEDGVEIGEIDLDESTATYSGSNWYLEEKVEDINDGIRETELSPMPDEPGKFRSKHSVTKTGDSLKEYLLPLIEDEVEYEIVEREE
ncbi:hypothetical protein [Halovivax cerinus]|uniref:Uncharacterized protein n=1 Tax=Halovivax cerinus TaxID=1487865 RepID=A0ABD5NNC4_9EURY|nr:hypothetical protein [Halovivax cerinus]